MSSPDMYFVYAVCVWNVRCVDVEEHQLSLVATQMTSGQVNWLIESRKIFVTRHFYRPILVNFVFKHIHTASVYTINK